MAFRCTSQIDIDPILASPILTQRLNEVGAVGARTLQILKELSLSFWERNPKSPQNVNQHHELTRAESTISIAFHADRRWDPSPLHRLSAGKGREPHAEPSRRDLFDGSVARRIGPWRVAHAGLCGGAASVVCRKPASQGRTAHHRLGCRLSVRQSLACSQDIPRRARPAHCRWASGSASGSIDRPFAYRRAAFDRENPRRPGLRKRSVSTGATQLRNLTQ